MSNCPCLANGVGDGDIVEVGFIIRPGQSSCGILDLPQPAIGLNCLGGAQTSQG